MSKQIKSASSTELRHSKACSQSIAARIESTLKPSSSQKDFVNNSNESISYLNHYSDSTDKTVTPKKYKANEGKEQLLDLDKEAYKAHSHI